MVRPLPALQTRAVTGGFGPRRGDISHREFDPDLAGGPIRPLRLERIRVTDAGLARVRAHLDRFGSGRAEHTMLDRLEGVASGRVTAEPEDIRFYAHELREGVRFRRLGVPEGQKARPGDSDEAAYSLWNNAHTATLEDYGIASDRDLYHPSAQRYLPE